MVQTSARKFSRPGNREGAGRGRRGGKVGGRRGVCGDDFRIQVDIV